MENICLKTLAQVLKTHVRRMSYRGGGSSLYTKYHNVEKQYLRKCVVASGGKAAIPPIEGLRDVNYLTNETFFNQTSRPQRFGVIGSGPIGSEMAQAMQLFGSEVTVFNRSNRILGKEDPEAGIKFFKLNLCACVLLIFLYQHSPY